MDTMNVIVFFLKTLCWLPINSQFVTQPGDTTQLAIPGYPLPGCIPCTLEHTPYRSVGWEKNSATRGLTSITANRTFHLPYNNTYEFRNNNPHDYSIDMKVVPSDEEPQFRCYVVLPPIRYSSWTNISYIVPPTETYPVCSVDSEHSPIEEGDNISLICRSRGAVPTATLTWYNRTSGELLTAGQQQPDIVATISVSKYDNGDTFQCTAKNEATRLLARTPNCSVHLNVSYASQTDSTTASPVINTVTVHAIETTDSVVTGSTTERVEAEKDASQTDSTTASPVRKTLTIHNSEMTDSVVTGSTTERVEAEKEGDNTLTIVIAVMTFVLLTFIAAFTVIWNCCQRRNQRILATRVERIEMAPARELVTPTVLVDRATTMNANIHITTEESDIESKNSSSTISIYDMPHPQYINEHIIKPEYTDLASGPLVNHSHSSQELEYEEIDDMECDTHQEYEDVGDTGYETPVNSGTAAEP